MKEAYALSISSTEQSFIFPRLLQPTRRILLLPGPFDDSYLTPRHRGQKNGKLFLSARVLGPIEKPHEPFLRILLPYIILMLDRSPDWAKSSMRM